MKLLEIKPVKAIQVITDKGKFLWQEVGETKLWFKPAFRKGHNGFNLVTNSELETELNQLLQGKEAQ